MAAANDKLIWLKVLIGFIFTLMLLMVTAGATQLDKKVNKDVFELYEVYQNKQFIDIKDSLTRIEDKL